MTICFVNLLITVPNLCAAVEPKFVAPRATKCDDVDFSFENVFLKMNIVPKTNNKNMVVGLCRRQIIFFIKLKYELLTTHVYMKKL